MATFSVNQARHLYVAKEVKTPHVVASDNAGAIALTANAESNHMYFEYKSVDGLLRSDLIDIKNIMYAKVTEPSAMAHTLKAVGVTLASGVNSGAPVGGQDYILRIAFRQFVGISDEHTYIKYGMVHAYTGMTASEFYKELAKSLVKNFSREESKLVTISLVDSESNTVAVDESTNWTSLAATYSKVIITEAPQPWKLGVLEQVPVYFEVIPTTITVSNDEVVWGTVSEEDSEVTLNNGKKIADLEYFCMGERGDVYRNVGWPNTIQTTYLVDPTQAYYVLDIHYAYTGNNEGVQKSEKDITIVTSTKAVINSLITAFNSATGMTLEAIV